MGTATTNQLERNEEEEKKNNLLILRVIQLTIFDVINKLTSYFPVHARLELSQVLSGFYMCSFRESVFI